MSNESRAPQNSLNSSEQAPYTAAFFDDIRSGSRRSAEIVVPIVMQLVNPNSVVDVGCGDGTWLSIFQRAGATEIFGMDGNYVDQERLQIPRQCFRATDLSAPFELSRTFDLATSLEVAEHLPAASAGTFVSSLVRLAPVVLFSAAIPRQGGTHHINEQWPGYWCGLFKRHEYVPIDCIRKQIWSNDDVEWWYAQNILLFVSKQHLQESSIFRSEYDRNPPEPLALVHPKRFMQNYEVGVLGAFRLLVQTSIKAIRRRF